MGVGLGKSWHLPPPQRHDVLTHDDLWPILRVLCLVYQWSSIGGKMEGWQNRGWIYVAVPLGSCDETWIPTILSLWCLRLVSNNILKSCSLSNVPGIPICIWIGCLRFIPLHILWLCHALQVEEGCVVHVQQWCLHYRASVVFWEDWVGLAKGWG